MGILSAFRFAFQNVFFTPVLYGVIASLAVFSATWEKGDRLKDSLTDQYRSQEDTFDFIIVGGGSAGSVLANRLSKWHRVLLLEAGGEAHPFQAIPALSLFIPNYPATDWSHKSVTQRTSCLACTGKRYTFSQGKNLGGSGNLNYLIHLRGSHKDFDNWARITGDERWSYNGVLNDFTASEHFEGTTTDPGAHGVGGPLQIEMPSEIGLANEWNWAGQELGYPHVDLNGKYDEGFDALYYPIKKGIRQATYLAFIQPVRNRPSLLIRKFAHVNKILIREGSNDAYGVQYDRHGKKKFAFANKEVIISAGTLKTPQILMLSGIGPPNVLQPFKIPVKAALPVGQNLHDHISTLVGPFFLDSKKTFSFDDSITPKSFLDFTQRGAGPLTTSGFQAAALLTSSYAKVKGQPGWPDIQLTLFGLSPHRLFSSDLAHAFGLKESILQRFFLHAMRKSAFFIVVSVARPESRGEVCLKSADPYKPLIIDPKYFSDPGNKDMSVMIEGINRALFLAENTTVFRNCGSHLTPKCFPLCEKHPFRSDAYWECYVRHMTITLNDHVGTAAMGYRTSPYSVVDSELRVMGINNLRVVDASVMPTVVGANTQAATIMIAEKASQFLLQKWKHDAIDYDSKGGNPQYGPPPLPQTNGEYGPPQSLPPVPVVPVPVGVKVVVDDSLGQLTPPGLHIPPGALGGYGREDYDSFNILKNQGQDTLGSFSGPSAATPRDQIRPTDGNSLALATSPQPLLPAAGFPVSTSPSTFSSSVSPSYPTQLATPTSALPPATTKSSFRPPQIYREVYDPITPSTTRPSQNSSPRGSKALDFSSYTPENLQDLSSPPTTTPNSPDSIGSGGITESFLSRGPGGQTVIVRRLRKRPLKVTVHPRGHLGYEDPERSPKPPHKDHTTHSPLSTTSIDPLPKDVVVIRQRRPVYPTRRQRRLKTTTTTEKNSVDDITTVTTGENTTTPQISRSVSDVLARLRNFIPTGGTPRGKRGHKEEDIMSMTTALPSYFYDSDNNNNTKNEEEIEKPDGVEEEDLSEDPQLDISEIFGDDGKASMLIFDNLDVLQPLKNSTENSTTEKDENSTTEISKRKNDNTTEITRDHPFVPVDMDPIPSIITSSADRSKLPKLPNDKPKEIRNQLSTMSPEDRKARMSKFVRRKTPQSSSTMATTVKS